MPPALRQETGRFNWSRKFWGNMASRPAGIVDGIRNDFRQKNLRTENEGEDANLDFLTSLSEITFEVGSVLKPELTIILQRLDQGHTSAADELLPLVYQELRKLASQKMARESPGQTLQATALVHEAWLRLGGEDQPEWKNRAHFFAAAAEAMRRILIDNARRKARLRHGGRAEHVNLDDLDLAAAMDNEELLALNEALDRLAAHDADAAQVVKLRFFAGLGNEPIAKVLGVSVPTVKRRWAYARAWLFREMNR
jgi:RNA polymerase sigma factor (TIGR02999 family)